MILHDIDTVAEINGNRTTLEEFIEKTAPAYDDTAIKAQIQNAAGIASQANSKAEKNHVIIEGNVNSPDYTLKYDDRTDITTNEEFISLAGKTPSLGNYFYHLIVDTFYGDGGDAELRGHFEYDLSKEYIYHIINAYSTYASAEGWCIIKSDVIHIGSADITIEILWDSESQSDLSLLVKGGAPSSGVNYFVRIKIYETSY